MQALAASCEELRARTGNPPLRWLNSGFRKNGKFTIQICIFSSFGQLLFVEKQKVSY
jgi:hypothetical protein